MIQTGSPPALPALNIADAQQVAYSPTHKLSVPNESEEKMLTEEAFFCFAFLSVDVTHALVLSVLLSILSPYLL